MQSKFKVDRTEDGKRKRTFGGVLFASELELRFYKDFLIPMRNRKEIKTITLQPKYLLQEGFVKNKKKILPINYIADFEVVGNDNRIIIYDVKGLPTAEAKIKRKLFDFRYPDKELVWIGYTALNGWEPYDKIQKDRDKRKKEKVQKGKKRL